MSLTFDTLLSLTADLSCLMQVRARRQNARGEAVQHPILDNIRRCSSTPDEAVDFFSRILHCIPDKRLTAAQALEHPYIRRCAAQMRAYLESQAACVQDAPVPISTEAEAHTAPVKQKLFVRVGGAVKKHGGRLARTAGHMLMSLPMFSCCTKPPLSAYFFDYKHEVEQQSPMQGNKEASTGGAELCSVREPNSTRQEQPSGALGTDDKLSSRAINIQARTCKQQAVTDQQTSGAPKVHAAQAVLPACQVNQAGKPQQAVPVEKEQMCSALPAVPAASLPCQPDLNQSHAEYEADQEQAPTVLSASRYSTCYTHPLLICYLP